MKRVLLLCALFAACTPSLPVPQGAQITCSAGDFCPSGWVCNNAGRCVPADQLDTTPPDLAGPLSVSAAVARAGTQLTFTFASTKPLSALPELQLDLDSPADATCAATA